jgi:hypothetical protein
VPVAMSDREPPSCCGSQWQSLHCGAFPNYGANVLV